MTGGSDGILREALKDHDGLYKAFIALPEKLEQKDLSELSEIARREKDYARSATEALIDNTDLPTSVRFAALYTHLVRHRHLADRDEFDALVEKYRFEFSDQPAMSALVTESLLNTARTVSDLERVEASARHTLAKFDSHGVRLQLSEAILEHHVRTGDRSDSELREVDDLVTQMLRDHPRVPRYWAARARVSAQLGHFDEARTALNNAVRYENSEAANYYVRLAEYEAIRSEIGLLATVGRIESRQASALREFEAARSELVGILGLLSAALAIVLIGTDLALSVAPRAAVGLLLAASASVTLLFVSYAAVIGRRIPRLGVMIAVAIATASLAAAWLIVWTAEDEEGPDTTPTSTTVSTSESRTSDSGSAPTQPSAPEEPAGDVEPGAASNGE